VRELQAKITQTADRLGLHATAPTLTLGLVTDIGKLAEAALAGSGNGRRPFRPTDDWARQLADIAFAVINLADQTGVDLEAELGSAIERREADAARLATDDLPF
jgi:NTP pyrophosphatase (non-canonical NTP hydrolase)